MTQFVSHTPVLALLATLTLGCGREHNKNTDETKRPDPENIVEARVASAALSGENPAITITADRFAEYDGLCAVSYFAIVNDAAIQSEDPEIGSHENGYFLDDTYIASRDGNNGCDTLENSNLNGVKLFLQKTFWTRIHGEEKSVPGDATKTAPVFHKLDAKMVRVKFSYSVETTQGNIPFNFSQDFELSK